MTTDELLTIAESEYNADGMLSKGTRIAIVEKARAGEQFSVNGSTYDHIRIGAALRKTGENKRMRTKTIDCGKKILIMIN